MFEILNPDYNPDDYKFDTLGEFKIYIHSGANLGFAFHDVEYGIEKDANGHYYIWICNEDVIAEDLTMEQLLNYEIDGVKIRDFIVNDAIITERLWA